MGESNFEKNHLPGVGITGDPNNCWGVIEGIADSSRLKQSEGQELTIDEAASIDAAYGSGFAKRAATDYLFGS